MTPPRSPTTDRRTVLAGFATSLGSIGLAGCLNESTESNEDEEGEQNGQDDQESEDPAENASSNGDESSATVHSDYETTDVRITTPDGDDVGEVTAAIADTPTLQRVGLSETEELPEDRGMLFVYEAVDDRTFIMPEMSFGIDIIFADEEGVITGIHHAPEPGPDEDGSEQTYPGRGQYVLEVGYEWTADRGVEEGDRLQFDL
ncbi:DUF192 domain-containing protein [Natrialba sp. PRR66]|uniref:DUF192 domain-containing protein n=1 Tax=Natrialba sp. PRR66 TaxID=3098146 RepID=UPI002B1D117A|nr:DUF192 domain-containing protein [Natrialba sp. PRR66]